MAPSSWLIKLSITRSYWLNCIFYILYFFCNHIFSLNILYKDKIMTLSSMQRIWLNLRILIIFWIFICFLYYLYLHWGLMLRLFKVYFYYIIGFHEMSANPHFLLNFTAEVLRNWKKGLCEWVVLSKERIHSRNGNVWLENQPLWGTSGHFFPFARHFALLVSLRYKCSFQGYRNWL